MDYGKYIMSSAILGFLIALMQTFVATPITNFLAGQAALVVSTGVIGVSLLIIAIVGDSVPAIKKFTSW